MCILLTLSAAAAGTGSAGGTKTNPGTKQLDLTIDFNTEPNQGKNFPVLIYVLLKFDFDVKIALFLF